MHSRPRSPALALAAALLAHGRCRPEVDGDVARFDALEDDDRDAAARDLAELACIFAPAAVPPPAAKVLASAKPASAKPAAKKPRSRKKSTA